jgi:hypothetical protein
MLDYGSVQTGVVQICHYIVIFPVLGALRFFISFLWSMTLTVLSLMLTTCQKKSRWTDENLGLVDSSTKEKGSKFKSCA